VAAVTRRARSTRRVGVRLGVGHAERGHLLADAKGIDSALLVALVRGAHEVEWAGIAARVRCVEGIEQLLNVVKVESRQR